MKKSILVISLLLLLVSTSKGALKGFSERHLHYRHEQIRPEALPGSYQQLKHQMLRLTNEKKQPPIFNFRRGTDFTMLYVAGGLLAATSTFVLLNGYRSEQGYFSESNTGVIIGGGFSTTLFITKFIIDNTR
jgi:hypothetical protein